MLRNLLHQTRALRRLALAGVAVAAVLLASAMPRASRASDGRPEEAVSEASEQLWHAPLATGDGPDSFAAVLPSAGPQLESAILAASIARPWTATAPLPRAPLFGAPITRGPPARV